MSDSLIPTPQSLSHKASRHAGSMTRWVKHTLGPKAMQVVKASEQPAEILGTMAAMDAIAGYRGGQIKFDKIPLDLRIWIGAASLIYGFWNPSKPNTHLVNVGFGSLASYLHTPATKLGVEVKTKVAEHGWKFWGWFGKKSPPVAVLPAPVASGFVSVGTIEDGVGILGLSKRERLASHRRQIMKHLSKGDQAKAIKDWSAEQRLALTQGEVSQFVMVRGQLVDKLSSGHQAALKEKAKFGRRAAIRRHERREEEGSAGWLLPGND